MVHSLLGSFDHKDYSTDGNSAMMTGDSTSGTWKTVMIASGFEISSLRQVGCTRHPIVSHVFELQLVRNLLYWLIKKYLTGARIV